MKKTKHTPGPWRVQKNVGPDKHSIIERIENEGSFGLESSHHVCKTYSWGLPGCAEERANANLIAAAPEMFKVLEDVLDYCEVHGGLGELLEMTKVKRALNKARGK